MRPSIGTLGSGFLDFGRGFRGVPNIFLHLYLRRAEEREHISTRGSGTEPRPGDSSSDSRFYILDTDGKLDIKPGTVSFPKSSLSRQLGWTDYGTQTVLWYIERTETLRTSTKLFILPALPHSPASKYIYIYQYG